MIENQLKNFSVKISEKEFLGIINEGRRFVKKNLKISGLEVLLWEIKKSEENFITKIFELFLMEKKFKKIKKNSDIFLKAKKLVKYFY